MPFRTCLAHTHIFKNWNQLPKGTQNVRIKNWNLNALSYLIPGIIERTRVIRNTCHAICPRHYGGLKWGNYVKKSCNSYICNQNE
uniref:Uncharacterized protein n=2 Tax=Anguilla anguilla TaxID=7936 RepID=A0A0E9Q857_ANGAN